MCDTIVTFGQRGSHFLQCPSRKDFTRLPRKLVSLLSSSNLQQVYHLALGFEDSFLVTWRDKNGEDHVDSQSLPTELREFIYARNAQRRLARNIPAIRCTLGPYNASYFAHDGSAYRWLNLPARLLTALESRISNGSWTDRPRIVALGANENYILLTENHTAAWDLGQYKAVSALIERLGTQENGVSEIHTITLHAYRYGGYTVQSRNGTITHENLPPHTVPGLNKMVPAILQDTKTAHKPWLSRKESALKIEMQRRPSNLQQRAQLRKEWGEHKQEFSAQSRGMKVKLSLSVSVGNLARFLG